MKIYIYILLGFFLSITGLQSQTKSAYLNAAAEAYEKEDYYSAMTYYQNALEFDEDDIDVYYKAAKSARIFNAYSLADTLYQKVLEKEENGEYPDATFWLANMKQKLGKYDKALEYYSQYLGENEGNDEFLTKKAKKEIEAVKWALEKQELAEINDEDTLVNLNYLNTPYSEMGIYVLGDSIFYSSLRFVDEEDENDPQRVYSKVLISQDSMEGEPVGNDFNKSDLHTAHTTFTQDKNRMYFTICDYISTDNIRCDLFYADIVEGELSEPVKLPDNINNDSITSTQPSIGIHPEDGSEVLYYVSNREGGQGMLDIWMTQRDEEGNFSDPENVEGINTYEDDITPYYDIAGKTLYFSSQGYLGFGGFDVYSTNFYEGKWTTPDNLGLPINSSYNDIYLTVDHKNDKILLSSNKKGSQYLEESTEACCYDIYRGELPYLKHKLIAQIFDEDTRDSLRGAKTTLSIVNTDLSESQQDDDKAEYKFKLKKNKEYKVMAEKEGYLPAEVSFSTRNIVDTGDIVKKLYLVTEELKLDVLVYTEADSMPLLGAKVLVIPNPGDPTEKINNDGNDFHYPLSRDRTYKVIASRKGFKPVSVNIRPDELRNVSRVVKKLYLPTGSLEDFLPLVLYFDNDHPNPDSWSSRTDVIYAETFNPYYERKDVFIEKYTEGMESASERNDAESKLNNFFETEVKKGNDDIIIFISLLDALLEKGQKIQIYLKGYSSPRYSRSYNRNLGQRRVSTVRNQLMGYKDGYFEDYIRSGQLVIKEKSFGETTAPAEVSGDLNNERLSIYSYDASKERRVEIVEVKFGE